MQVWAHDNCVGKRALLGILLLARQSVFQQPCCPCLLQAISSYFCYPLLFGCKRPCKWSPILPLTQKVQEQGTCFLFSWIGMPPMLASVTTTSQRSTEYGQGWLQQQLISPCQGSTKNIGIKGAHSETPTDWLHHEIKEEQNWDLQPVAAPFTNQEACLEAGRLWWQLPPPSFSNLMPLHTDANHTLHPLFLHLVCCCSPLLLPDSKSRWNNRLWWQPRSPNILPPAGRDVHLLHPLHFHLLQTFRNTWSSKCWYNFSSSFNCLNFIIHYFYNEIYDLPIKGQTFGQSFNKKIVRFPELHTISHKAVDEISTLSESIFLPLRSLFTYTHEVKTSWYKPKHYLKWNTSWYKQYTNCSL